MIPQEKLASASDHKILCMKNKIGKNFRDFQVKEEGHHNMQWCP